MTSNQEQKKSFEQLFKPLEEYDYYIRCECGNDIPMHYYKDKIKKRCKDCGKKWIVKVGVIDDKVVVRSQVLSENKKNIKS